MSRPGITLFLGGDVMTGRGIDQIQKHPVDPQLYESWACSAVQYVDLAEVTSEALAYSWENWRKVAESKNPAGWVYRVGQSRSRRFFKKPIQLVLIWSAIGFGVVTSLADDGVDSFALPAGQLMIWLVVAAVAGLIASLGPARKAARLDVLKAISYE